MKKETKGIKKGSLSQKTAIICTALLLAAGGIFTFYQDANRAPELTAFVDHGENASVIIGDEAVPLGIVPGTKTKKKVTKKTVKLKKASTKTYKKQSKKTKKRTKTEKFGTQQATIQTTVVTLEQQQFKKKSNKKVVTTTVTTTTKTTVKQLSTSGSSAASSGSTSKTSTAKPAATAPKVEENVPAAAPLMDERVTKAFKELGFELIIDSSVSYSGYFNARTQSIRLKFEDDTIYHEMGHFLAFIAGNADTKDSFKAIYAAEKDKVTGANKNYVTQDSSEYFAESFLDYTVNPSELKNTRPRTFTAMEEALDKVTDTQIKKIKTVYAPVWK